MANNQPYSSLFVVPSDTINIPQPGILTTGTNSSGGSNNLPIVTGKHMVDYLPLLFLLITY